MYSPPLRSFGRLSSLVGRSEKLLDDDLSFLDRWWTVHLTEISVQGPLRERRCRATTYRVQLPLACCIAETYTGSFTPRACCCVSLNEYFTALTENLTKACTLPA
jgi:hypothetical protein